MNQLITAENILSAYSNYLAYECGPEEQCGFIREPHGWVFITRQGRGYVNPLFHPQSLDEALDVMLPGQSLASVVGQLPAGWLFYYPQGRGTGSVGKGGEK